MAQHELEEALAGFPVTAPPDRLLRFYDEEAVAALNEGTIKVGPPAEMNDPFEMWAGVTTEGLTEDQMISSLTAERGMFREMMRRERPEFLKSEKEYQRRAIQMVLEKPDLWLEHLKSYADSMASLGEKSVGIACFSAFSDEDLNGPLGILHWAIYGGRHRGFLIEYDGKHDFLRSWSATKWFFPVTYVDDRQLLNLKDFDDWSDATMWRMLRQLVGVKCKRAWGNEKEWRLVLPLSAEAIERSTDARGRPLHVLRLWPKTITPQDKFPGPAVIKRVILGAKADDALKTAILRSTEQAHLAHVEVWEARPCERGYELRTIPLKKATV